MPHRIAPSIGHLLAIALCAACVLAVSAFPPSTSAPASDALDTARAYAQRTEHQDRRRASSLRVACARLAFDSLARGHEPAPALELANRCTDAWIADALRDGHVRKAGRHRIHGNDVEVEFRDLSPHLGDTLRLARAADVPVRVVGGTRFARPRCSAGGRGAALRRPPTVRSAAVHRRVPARDGVDRTQRHGYTATQIRTPHDTPPIRVSGSMDPHAEEAHMNHARTAFILLLAMAATPLSGPAQPAGPATVAPPDGAVAFDHARVVRLDPWDATPTASSVAFGGPTGAEFDPASTRPALTFADEHPLKPNLFDAPTAWEDEP